jgi:hypothetical protein
MMKSLAIRATEKEIDSYMKSRGERNYKRTLTNGAVDMVDLEKQCVKAMQSERRALRKAEKTAPKGGSKKLRGADTLVRIKEEKGNAKQLFTEEEGNAIGKTIAAHLGARKPAKAAKKQGKVAKGTAKPKKASKSGSMDPERLVPIGGGLAVVATKDEAAEYLAGRSRGAASFELIASLVSVDGGIDFDELVLAYWKHQCKVGHKTSLKSCQNSVTSRLNHIKTILGAFGLGSLVIEGRGHGRRIKLEQKKRKGKAVKRAGAC